MNTFIICNKPIYNIKLYIACMREDEKMNKKDEMKKLVKMIQDSETNNMDKDTILKISKKIDKYILEYYNNVKI